MWKIINGDVLEELAKLKDRGEKVDAVITDPPYCSGGCLPSSRKASVSAKYLDRQWEQVKEFQDSLDPNAMWDFTRAWMRACYSLIDSGYLFVCSDWRQISVFASAMQSAGFNWAGIVPWNKTNARPNRGRFTPLCEYVVYGFKGSASEKFVKGLIEAPPPQSAARIHPTEKPVALWDHLLQILPDDARLVVDPFCGSASSGEAAIARGLDYIGIDISDEFARCARERLEGKTCG